MELPFEPLAEVGPRQPELPFGEAVRATSRSTVAEEPVATNSSRQMKLPFDGQEPEQLALDFADTNKANTGANDAALALKYREGMARQEFAEQASWKTSNQHGDELIYHAYERHPSAVRSPADRCAGQDRLSISRDDAGRKSVRA